MFGVGRKPLLAVDHPVLAVALGAGDEHSRIGAALRFGHRIAGADFTVEQRLQIAGLLLVGAEHREDLGVAGIRCLATENRWRPTGPADDLVEQRQLDLPVALPTQLGCQVGGPQALFFDLALQRTQDRHGLGIFLVVRIECHQIQRLELVDHELLDPVQFLLVFGVRFEVPHSPQPRSLALPL